MSMKEINLLVIMCCCCCFTFSALVANNPKKLLFYTVVANPARGLLNRGKKKESGSAPAPPHAAHSEKIKIKITRRTHMSS